MEQNIDVDLGIMGCKHWNLDGEKIDPCMEIQNIFIVKMGFLHCVANSNRRNNTIDSLVANGSFTLDSIEIRDHVV